MKALRLITIGLILCVGAGLFGIPAACRPGPGISSTLAHEFISRLEPPAFDVRIFETRRRHLLEKMSGQAAVITAAAGNDFLYLTGLTGERQAAAVLIPGAEHPFVLFVFPRRPMATLWDGERPGIEGAVETFGADAAYPAEQFEKMLPRILADRRSVSYHDGDRRIADILKTWAGGNRDRTIQADLAPILHERRVVKDDWEIAQLENAVEVTALAQRRVLQTAAPGQMEYDIQAEIEYVFRKNGLPVGFSSIVGSGPNAAVLHYPGNTRRLEDGDLLLMDIGASCRGYVADVTRTIPVNGRFSEPQKELYDLVLRAQEEAIALMVPGNRILDPHHRATQIIVDGLHEMGLITDPESWWQKRFYIHYRNNHYIGLNVHDVGSYGDLEPADRDSYILDPKVRGRDIVPGMVMTIEPGVYLLADRLDHLHELFGDRASAEELDAFAAKVRPVYEKYAGIGIRIEDDVLITETGNRVLSNTAPKTVADIEAAMKRQ
jgi:Xaa-Pro aminopeptidase